MSSVQSKPECAQCGQCINDETYWDGYCSHTGKASSPNVHNVQLHDSCHEQLVAQARSSTRAASLKGEKVTCPCTGCPNSLIGEHTAQRRKAEKYSRKKYDPSTHKKSEGEYIIDKPPLAKSSQIPGYHGDEGTKCTMNKKDGSPCPHAVGASSECQDLQVCKRHLEAGQKARMIEQQASRDKKKDEGEATRDTPEVRARATLVLSRCRRALSLSLLPPLFRRCTPCPLRPSHLPASLPQYFEHDIIQEGKRLNDYKEDIKPMLDEEFKKYPSLKYSFTPTKIKVRRRRRRCSLRYFCCALAPSAAAAAVPPSRFCCSLLQLSRPRFALVPLACVTCALTHVPHALCHPSTDSRVGERRRRSEERPREEGEGHYRDEG